MLFSPLINITLSDICYDQYFDNKLSRHYSPPFIYIPSIPFPFPSSLPLSKSANSSSCRYMSLPPSIHHLIVSFLPSNVSLFPVYSFCTLFILSIYPFLFNLSLFFIFILFRTNLTARFFHREVLINVDFI